MTDEEFVLKFLNKNYTLIVSSSDFLFLDKLTQKNFVHKEFHKEMEIILGKIPDLGLFVNKWFNQMSVILVADLYKFFDSLDLSLKTKECLELVGSFCFMTKSYSREFSTKRFIDYYVEKFINSEVFDDIKGKVNLEHHTSGNMFALLDKYFVGETNEVIDKIGVILNEWYFDNVMGGKLKTFLDRSEVYLGRTNWEFRNLDYGVMDIGDVTKCFPNETPYQKTLLVRLVRDWYEQEVVLVSEKAFKDI